MFYVDLYIKFKDRFNYFYLLECRKTFDVKPIDLLYCNICNIQISPHNFDPARLLSIHLLHTTQS